MSDENRKARTFFFAIFFFALFFWAWAVKNTVEMDKMLDLGVVSFGTVLLSSVCMLGFLSNASLGTCEKAAKNVTTASHSFVALNYLLGSFIGFMVMERPGYGIYCVVFTFLWFGIAYYGHSLMHSQVLAGEGQPLND